VGCSDAATSDAAAAEPYARRMARLRAALPRARAAAAAHARAGGLPLRLDPLLPVALGSAAALRAFEADCLRRGFEGVVLRAPDGGYKFGRSTLRQGWLLKLKRFADAEARVIGVEELVHGEDAAREGSGLLGAFVLRSPAGVTFRVGSGLTDAQRRDFWRRRAALVGALVKYKSMVAGVKTAPRHPVFLGVRHADDAG
jgi:DNA ligase-1